VSLPISPLDAHRHASERAREGERGRERPFWRILFDACFLCGRIKDLHSRGDLSISPNPNMDPRHLPLGYAVMARMVFGSES
jgi:hypothetical protein